MIKYGIDWDDSFAEFQIELFLYRFPEKASQIEACKDLTPKEHFKRAMQLLWPDYKWNENIDLILDCWVKYRHIAIMGHTRATKTFSIAYIVATEYLADPSVTRVVCTTVSLDSLRNNLWANVLEAFDSAAISLMKPEGPMNVRNTDREICFSEEHKDRRYCIKGVATGEDKKAQGRIQGQHADRSIVVIDEAQQTGEAIYDASVNLESDPFFRCVYLGNPEERMSPYGDACEPENGWETVDVNHRFWETNRREGCCIHFDGLTSPNVVAGEEKYPYLITQEYIDGVRRTYGEDSTKWWAWVRGWFPPEGTVSRIFSQPTIDLGAKSFEFANGMDRLCASLDPGFGGDRCVVEIGRYGPLDSDPTLMAVRWEKTIEIPVRVGPGYDEIEFQICNYFIELMTAMRIEPDDCIIDGTARGAGIVAIIRRNWDMGVNSIEYGGSPSGRLLLPGDRRPCNEIYDRKVSEMWCAASEFMTAGQFGNLPKDILNELFGRQMMDAKAGTRREALKIAVETKKEYRKRLHRSPDLGDAAVQFVELIRRKGARLKGQEKWNDTSERKLDFLRDSEEDLYNPEEEFSYHESVS